MSNADQKPSTDGLMTWLAGQLGEIQRSIGGLHANTMGNRQTLVEIYHQLTHRMDRLEDRITNGHRKLGWIRHIPWFKISLLAVAALLISTGHLTVTELKTYVVRKLTD